MFDTLSDEQKHFLAMLDNPDFAKCVVEHPQMREALRQTIQKEAATAIRYTTPRGR